MASKLWGETKVSAPALCPCGQGRGIPVPEASLSRLLGLKQRGLFLLQLGGCHDITLWRVTREARGEGWADGSLRWSSPRRQGLPEARRGEAAAGSSLTSDQAGSCVFTPQGELGEEGGGCHISGACQGRCGAQRGHVCAACPSSPSARLWASWVGCSCCPFSGEDRAGRAGCCGGQPGSCGWTGSGGTRSRTLPDATTAGTGCTFARLRFRHRLG